jgi:hypothetical protein
LAFSQAVHSDRHCFSNSIACRVGSTLPQAKQKQSSTVETGRSNRLKAQSPSASHATSDGNESMTSCWAWRHTGPQPGPFGSLLLYLGTKNRSSSTVSPMRWTTRTWVGTPCSVICSKN